MSQQTSAEHLCPVPVHFPYIVFPHLLSELQCPAPLGCPSCERLLGAGCTCCCQRGTRALGQERRDCAGQSRNHCQHSLQSFQHPPSAWAGIFSQQCVPRHRKYPIFPIEMKNKYMSIGHLLLREAERHGNKPSASDRSRREEPRVRTTSRIHC